MCQWVSIVCIHDRCNAYMYIYIILYIYVYIYIYICICICICLCMCMCMCKYDICTYAYPCCTSTRQEMCVCDRMCVWNAMEWNVLQCNGKWNVTCNAMYVQSNTVGTGQSIVLSHRKYLFGGWSPPLVFMPCPWHGCCDRRHIWFSKKVNHVQSTSADICQIIWSKLWIKRAEGHT